MLQLHYMFQNATSLQSLLYLKYVDSVCIMRLIKRINRKKSLRCTYLNVRCDPKYVASTDTGKSSKTIHLSSICAATETTRPSHLYRNNRACLYIRQDPMFVQSSTIICAGCNVWLTGIEIVSSSHLTMFM